jgi:two-component system phosphate regulon sensor histidine kinase PhoR
MKLIMRLSVRWKLMITYVVIILVILVTITVYINRTLKSYYLDQTKDRLRREADLARTYISHHISDPLFLFQTDTLADEIGEKLGLRVTIVDPQGAVRGDSEFDEQTLMHMENHANRHEIMDAFQKKIGTSIRYSYTLNTDMMYLAVPLVHHNENIGVVRLALPLNEIDRALRDVRSILGVASGFGLVLALLLSYVTARAVTRPLHDMSQIAERMAQGDFSRKTIVRSRDEVGQLATTLNEMALQLDRTIHEITTERDRLRGVLSGMREGVMLTDKEGRIVLTNDALLNLFRITSPIEGRTAIETIRDAKLHGAIEKALKNKQEVIEEIELAVPKERILYIHVVPLGLPPNLTGTVVVLHDVTQLKRLEKVRKDFVANVSHELNTPLAAIKGYAETLLDKALDDTETARKFLKIIFNHGERMSKLVSDLLALSKLESDTYAPLFGSQNVHNVVSSIIETFKDALEKKKLSYHVDIPPDLPLVKADEKGLEQVVLNLLDNAVKFTPEGGTITITAYEEERAIKIAVSDTGIGIPINEIPRVFERFYRVDRDRSRELGGTGLGLSIIKYTVQAHGGHVWVESQVGQGTTFYFTIPKA